MRKMLVSRDKAGQTVVAMWHPGHAEYAFYTPDEFQAVADQLRALPANQPINRQLQRITLGSVETVTVDQDGYVELIGALMR